MFPIASDLSYGIFAGLSVIVTTLFSFSFWKYFTRKYGHRDSNLQYHSQGKFSRSIDPLSELRDIRESGIRDSARVVELWREIESRFSQLGIDKWTVVEQVFIAALDTANDPLAHHCLNLLRGHFKKSCRVNRLFGMYLEHNGRFDDARAVYTQLLNDDPTNILARKRMIAVLKAQRKISEAIEELRQYLKLFMSDYEAWNELADLYLSESDYKHAAFCVEELILSNPHNHLYCQRYAEIKYTEGGMENLELARTYYARACQLNPDCLRNLYGLLLTCSALDNHGSKANWESVTVLRSANGDVPTRAKSVGDSIKDNSQDLAPMPVPDSISFSELNRLLARWASERIRSVYQTAFAAETIHSLNAASTSTSSSRPKKTHSPVVEQLHSSFPNHT